MEMRTRCPMLTNGHGQTGRPEELIALTVAISRSSMTRLAVEFQDRQDAQRAEHFQPVVEGEPAEDVPRKQRKRHGGDPVGPAAARPVKGKIFLQGLGMQLFGDSLFVLRLHGQRIPGPGGLLRRAFRGEMDGRFQGR